MDLALGVRAGLVSDLLALPHVPHSILPFFECPVHTDETSTQRAKGGAFFRDPVQAGTNFANDGVVVPDRLLDEAQNFPEAPKRRHVAVEVGLS